VDFHWQLSQVNDECAESGDTFTVRTNRAEHVRRGLWWKVSLGVDVVVSDELYKHHEHN
jgi:hypothetical protein